MKREYGILCMLILCLFPGMGFSQIKIGISLGGEPRTGSIRLTVNGPNKMPLKNIDAYILSFTDTIRPSKKEKDILFFENLYPGERMLKVMADGYEDVIDTVMIRVGVENRKTVSMKNRMVSLKTVTVKGKTPAMVFKGDTIQFNPTAANIIEGDVARAILEQMPDVDINETSVKVHGNEIERTYVDGKKIFGDNPMTALDHVDATDVVNIKAYEEENKDKFRRGDKRKRWVLNIASKSKMINSMDGSAIASAGKTMGNTTIGNHDYREAIGGAFNFFSEDLLLTTNLMHNNENINSNLPAAFSQVSYNIPDYSENSYAGLSLVRNWSQRKKGLTKMEFGYRYIRTKKENGNQLIRDYYANDDYEWRKYESSGNTISRENKHSFNSNLVFDAGNGHSFQSTITGDFVRNHGVDSGILSDNTNNSVSQTKSIVGSHNIINNIQYVITHNKDWKKYSLSTRFSYRINNADNTISRNLLTVAHGVETHDELEIPVVIKDREVSLNTRLSNHVKWSWLDDLTIDYSFLHSNGNNNRIAYDMRTGLLDSLNTYHFKQTKTLQQLDFSFRKNNKHVEYFIKTGPSIVCLRDNDLLVQDRSKYTFTPWILISNIKIPHLTEKMAFGFEYNISSHLPDVMQLRKITNDSNPYYVITGNPFLKPSTSHKWRIGSETRLNKYGRQLSSELSFETIQNDIVSRSWYYKDPTFLPNIKYQTIGNSTVSSYDNIQGKWNVGGSLSLLLPFTALRSSVKVSVSDKYSHNPYYYNGYRDVTRINVISGSISLKTSFLPQTTLSLTNTMSYNNSLTAQSNQGFKAFNNALNTTLRIKQFMKRFFLNASYRMRWQKQISLHKIEHENMLNVYVGTKLFKGKGELGIVVYDVLNDANKQIFKMHENYTEVSETTNYGRFAALTFTWSFRKLNSSRSDIMRGLTW